MPPAWAPAAGVLPAVRGGLQQRGQLVVLLVLFREVLQVLVRPVDDREPRVPGPGPPRRRSRASCAWPRSARPAPAAA